MICEKCGDNFPLRAVIDGRQRNLQKRKYCLTCSPFGNRNTKKLNGEKRKDQIDQTNKIYKCSCGETDKENFYGNKNSVCAKCHNKYTLKKGQEKRKKAIEYLGGKCYICGYNKYYGAIDIHHIDKENKHDDFHHLRSWSWDRIVLELQNCIALCRVCHSEVHAGITECGSMVDH